MPKETSFGRKHIYNQITQDKNKNGDMYYLTVQQLRQDL